jgi:transcriptional regulator with XRE-family HTH domain
MGESNGNGATGPGPVIGLSLRTLRAERGLTQEQALEMLRWAGLDWTRSNVASLESGRRQDITLSELVLMTVAFGVPLSRWLQGHGHGVTYEVRTGRAFNLNHVIAGLLDGNSPNQRVNVPLEIDPEPIYLEAELHAAERLGVEPGELRRAAERLWGRRLVEERERRLESGRIAGIGSSVPTAKRGHVTRTLLRELATAMEESGDGR